VLIKNPNVFNLLISSLLTIEGSIITNRVSCSQWVGRVGLSYLLKICKASINLSIVIPF